MFFQEPPQRPFLEGQSADLHSTYLLKSIYAYAQPADPVWSLRLCRSATKLSRRPYVASTGCRSLGPKGTPGTPPPPHPQGTQGTQGTQRDPRDPRGDPRGPKGAQGRPKGSQGDPRAPSAPLGGWGPWGPLGLFRSYFEWMVISIGWD